MPKMLMAIDFFDYLRYALFSKSKTKTILKTYEPTQSNNAPRDPKGCRSGQSKPKGGKR